MDPTLIITGLAGALVTVVGTFFKFLLDIISELRATIKEQNEREQRRLLIQESTTQTLQKVVDVGMERLRSQPPEPPS